MKYRAPSLLSRQKSCSTSDEQLSKSSEVWDAANRCSGTLASTVCMR
jgi:hypothetical protein